MWGIIGSTTQRLYDANGNPAGTYSFRGFPYDIENRLVAIQGEGAVYAYNAQNQRVWRAVTVSGKTTEVFYFYGIDGKMIQSYAPTYPVYQGETYMALGTEEQGLYFAGRLVGRSSGLGSLEAVSTDGIGTARWDNSLNGLEAWFYPWGEERGTVTANDRVKFATYRRDSESSLDYAGNRYYDNVTGRFMTADPYGGSGVAGDPQSWNKYAYRVLGTRWGGLIRRGGMIALRGSMSLATDGCRGIAGVGAVVGASAWMRSTRRRN